MSHKIAALKVFMKLHKSPLLKANINKGAVLGLKQFSALKALEK